MKASIQQVGLGLRSPHMEQILANRPDVPWFELLTDNWLDASGIDGFLLDKVTEQYPVTLHGVAMNLGGVDPLNLDYLSKVKALATRCEANWISDHLSFSAVDGKQLHDLGPLPYTEESLQHMITRINEAQDVLGQTLIVENISAYVAYEHSTINEAEFLNALAAATQCKILLDVNNLYVNQKNLGQDASDFIDTLHTSIVKEIHLGGYTDKGEYLLDAHNNPVSEPVWALYEAAIQKFSGTPTLIEWDNDLPDFQELLKEQQKAMAIMSKYREMPLFA
jgi:uncharacterized protein (UPF0276 family)